MSLSPNQLRLATDRGSQLILGPLSMVFRFREQELTPIIEEIESFLDWEHCLGIDAIIPTHKPSNFKNFHALDIPKNFLVQRSFRGTYTSSFQLLTGKKLKEVL